ncbi:ABC transporter substrate-binding protein [Actinoplanes teichomyceticus]|uniref:Carbohydrate ABC transporter substrate-binding protein (CUT1 family) n=1 Tax=Actinoplanes teichomyceticus TaxID=1867 RepID=A0A561WA54_ACTTI|nr:extracellular solute-binding protein [Actinoplanes teichomyceticus]TWG20729.1 carbohydrate ABC transporter substrate-binding protein (CUT1 family) [Actinoplanes teichomyceticus]GIF14385.1 sugar ABC transporter substrate-binding protein [Actinoplanes teichomyceticus]
MRKTYAPLLAALTAATLFTTAACSGSDDESSGGGAGDEKVSLTYWSWAPNMDKVVEGWNSTHPNIQVTVNKQDGGDPAVTKLLTAIKAGSGAPDVMQAEYQKIPTLVSADALADISAEAGSLKDRFPAATWNSVTLGSDAVYGVPQDSGPLMFFYRADVFAKIGLPAPTTWDDYAKAAEKIHKANPKQYLGTFSATDAGLFAGLAQQAGASWWGMNGDSWTVDINDAATQKVASYWGGLVEKGVIDNKPMYTPEWNAALNDGSQVGWVSAVWAPGVLEGSAKDTLGKWKAALMPQWDAASPATGNWGGSATSVTSQSKHKKQAAEFVAWLNSDPAALELLAGTANVYPAANDATSTALTEPPAFFADQKDFYAIAAEAAKTTRPFTYGPNVNVAYSAFNDAFGKAAESKKAAAFTESLATMQKTTVEDMKNSGFSVAG